jgi:hypothetical protein
VVVLDLPSLAPVGALPPGEYTLDAKAGRLYGLAGADLLVYAEAGGQPEPPPPPEAAAFPAEGIRFIRPSPDCTHDQTVFVGVGEAAPLAYNTLYRSTDGGKSWVLLRGGLPHDPYVALDLAVSPGFAMDHTLFAGGFRGTLEGLGVFRSTDGGDTWQPASEGLRQLRIEAVVLSPDYPGDGTLLAFSRSSVSDGPSLQLVSRSTDRGRYWTSLGSGTPADWAGFLPPGSNVPEVQFRINPSWTKSGGGVDRWMASTGTWETVFHTDQHDEAPVAVLPSPHLDADHTVYILMRSGLWRSTDLGETWERCPRPRLDGRQYPNWVTAGALAGNRLLVGTMTGEFWTVNLENVTCEPDRPDSGQEQ